jgi:hypothetical protein
VGVIRQVLDSQQRADDFAWLVVSNGRVSIRGSFDARGYDALHVTVDYHGMLDPKTVDRDIAMPALRLDGFVARKQRSLDNNIEFVHELQLTGLSHDAPVSARMVAHDAALSFVRPSGNRSRMIGVRVQGVDDQDQPIGNAMAQRLFDVEYRWREVEKEEARFDGSASELSGDLIDRAEAVVKGIRERNIVAAVLSHTSSAVPHTEAALVTRLRRYDNQLQTYPTLVKDTGFLAGLGVTSDTLMPMLMGQLAATPSLGSNLEFKTNYNLCAQYTLQAPIHA